MNLRPEIVIPQLPDFRPLPAEDPGFSAAICRMVEETGLSERTPAESSPDGKEEWASICVADLADIECPRVGGWEAGHFIYPASTYKMYVLGEAVRQVCAGEISLDDMVRVAEHNVREQSRLEPNQHVTVSEVLRLMCQYSDNTAANVAIDLVNRERASALLRAMGCSGSDITRKFLPRSREDQGYGDVPGTESCARHFAEFLWAVETGAIGGGRGRGLIKGYLGTISTNVRRLRAGLPPSATIYSKTGEWNIFSSECGIVEDGPIRYLFCALTALPHEIGAPRIARFAGRVHQLVHRTGKPAGEV